MIKWYRMDEEPPTIPGKIYLVQERGGMVTSAYWSGDSWHVPWGDEYKGSEQPLIWAVLNFPRL